MLYRFKSCQNMLRSGSHGTETILYRGVSHSSAVNDLAKNRLFFSQAIAHNDSDSSQEAETFRTECEWRRVYEELELSRDDYTLHAHADFIDRGDQYFYGVIFQWHSIRISVISVNLIVKVHYTL